MGHRANLVIKRAGAWTLGWDRWLASRIDGALFWGPALTEVFIDQMALDQPAAWLDEVWVEGGALLDWDQLLLLWFGGENILFDVPLRRVHLKLMQRQWPGWVVRWAHGGLADIRAQLGLDPNPITVARAPSPAASFTVDTEAPHLDDAILSVVEQGRTTLTRVRFSQAALALGLRGVRGVFSSLQPPPLVWTGEPPVGGVHLDLDRQILRFWTAEPTHLLEARVARGWAGWQVLGWRDEFERQVAATRGGIVLPARSPRDLEEQIIAHLEHLIARQGPDPVIEPDSLPDLPAIVREQIAAAAPDPVRLRDARRQCLAALVETPRAPPTCGRPS